ncbi:hypothetical protein Y032_0473g2116 [Ancylostoma ceylanicum]|uniref:Endonuclease/exonuclease/phosphatase domain-containing protein n=1 Tax=Ancylostoma ceylanicum TaxID=53326 RepID=A0A016WWZ0_9BILA|nr:hypothetical protein Y032_0473g2116 [Ancylostoma ceylanicum]
MKSGRLSLTKHCIHSYARKDFTKEELEYDRALRRKAGALNQLEGKLVYVVRDLTIHKLRNPRALPYQASTQNNPQDSMLASNSPISTDSPLQHTPTLKISISEGTQHAPPSGRYDPGLGAMQRNQYGPLLNSCLNSNINSNLNKFTNRFVLFNSRSIVNKLPDLGMLLSHNPYGVFITENWCKPHTIPDALLSYKNCYNVFRCDRRGLRPGGGVAVLIHKLMPHSLVAIKDFSDFCQVICIQISNDKEPTLVVTVYRSPSCSDTDLAQCLGFINALLSHWSFSAMVIGDFNFPLIYWVNMTHRGGSGPASSRNFLEFAKLNGLVQLVRKPTHGLNTLDIILATHPDQVKDIVIGAPFSTSDHNTISFEIVGCHAKSEKSVCSPRNSAKGNYNGIVSELATIDWIGVINCSVTADQCYSKFVSICRDLIDRYIPPIRGNPKNDLRPALSKKRRCLQSKVDFYHRNLHKYNRVYYKYARKLKRKLALRAASEEQRVANSRNPKLFLGIATINYSLALISQT